MTKWPSHLHGTFACERRPVVAAANLDEVTGHRVIRAQLDRGTLRSLPVAVPLPGRELLPPGSAYDHRRGARQRARLDLRQRLFESVTPSDHRSPRGAVSPGRDVELIQA